MAKNKVQIDVRVDDKGSLQQVDKKAKKTAKSMGELDRNIKGTGQQSANTTKNFSKMSQGMGGLVGAYATLAARIFALTAAFNFLKTAGNLAALEAGQESYARRTGTSMRLLSENIQAASAGMVSYRDAAQAAAIGNAAGLTADQLSRLAAIAKNAGTTLGRDVTDSFNRLTRGAIKAEPELLDELGIIVRLKDASEDYARALNKNANELTTFEKSQAVVNATIAQGEQKFDDIGENVNNVSRLGASLEDTFKKIQIALAGVADFISSALIDSTMGLISVLGVLGVSFLRAITPAAPQLENIAKAAEGAKQRIMQAAKAGPQTTATAKKLGIGEMGKREFMQLTRASTAANSKIRADLGLTAAQFRMQMAAIRAEAIITAAEGQGAFAKMFATWRAGLLYYQAQHGAVMGTLKFLTAGAAAVMSTLLSWAVWIGLAVILVNLLSKAFDYLTKSEELRKLETLAKNAGESFARTNEEISKIRSGLDEARSPMEHIVQQANILSNYKFTELNQLINNLRGLEETINFDIQLDPTKVAALKTASVELENAQAEAISYAAKKYEEAFNAVFDTFEGEDFKKISAVFTGLSSSSEMLENRLRDIGDVVGETDQGFLAIKAQLSEFDRLVQAGLNPDDPEAFLEAIQNIDSVYKELKKRYRDAETGIHAQAQAYKGLVQVLERFTKGTEAFRVSDSPFTPLINSLTDAINSVKTFGREGESAMAFLSGTEGYEEGQYNALLRLAGLRGEELDNLRETITLGDIRIRIEQRLAKIREEAYRMERQSLAIQTANYQLQVGATKGQVERLNAQTKILNVQNEIDRLDAQKRMSEENGVALAGEELKLYEAQRAQLEAQLTLLQQQTNEAYQLEMAIKNAFESGFESGLADIIKGKESSLRDAIAGLAKSVLESVADTIAKQMTNIVVDFLFGKKDDPAEKMQNAIVAGADYHAAQIRAAMTGSPAGDGLDFIRVNAQRREPLGSATASTGVGSTPIIGSSPMGNGVTTLDEQIKATSLLYGKPDAAANGKGSLDNFLVSFGNIFDSNAEGGFMEKLGNAFQAGGNIFSDLFSGLGSILGDLLGGAGGGLGGLLSAGMSLFGFADGGVISQGKKMRGYATGGIASGSRQGYPAMLHGTEAVVPLPNGRSIPVEMAGGGSQMNNVTVNVSMEGGTAKSETQSDSKMGGDLGNMIAQAVQKELQNQKRSGGILNPYGAS